ncbi:hypothetical protein TCAL_05887 [Tigriopus californicus]|uniref:Protein kinase domain-containing protein n=1 Tax=Tigriopus californicus TaxID=6832 RepID=A0A553PNH5_TIGCA|nr:hypothetical protein TCAL_05887 [Tigriopus californicus]
MPLGIVVHQRGLFATVRKCTHRETGIQYAAKFSSRIRCGVDCSMEVLHEIAMLYICNESNKIVHLKDVFQNRYEIILVLEYAPGGDFQSVLDEDMVPFEEDVQGFLKQIIEALKFIHDKDIAHLDIKPQNIVLMGQFPNCEIKLCDLEVARVIQKGESIREIIGTPDYVAPEILSLDSITLAADIWSLGVLAYVLLTGFSPFGGDSDQETLRNISNAQLDFPSELFEGVSDQAKDFISQCLKRKPSERPTIKECLQHQWLVEDEEPPSPSPLMLKIPTPDTFKTHHPSHSTSPQGSTHHLNSHATTGASRRSCQTCRDRVTERKRYLSKSREAIFEKVAQSNLKKSLSKSRERLCDMRLTLSKSREYLSDKAQDQKSISKSQEKLPNFKSLSKSQEVISNALGGAMKRMSNGAGAVSDISQALLSMDSGNGLDLLLLPGNQILSKNNGSLQLLPFTEQMLAKTDLETRTECPVEPIIIVNEPILEVHEEEEDEEEKEEEEPEDVKKEDTEEPKEDNKKEEGDERKEISQNEQSSTETGHETSTIGKDEQGSKDSMVFKEGIVSSENSTPSPTPGDGAKSVKNESARTNSIGVQVNIAPNETLDPHAVTRRAGFNHSSTLGARRAKAQPWRNELGKIKLHKKVSELIGTFDRSENNVDTLEELKLKRRGSLQIEGDINITGHEVADILAAERKLKLQRRKSTSAILNAPISDMTILNLNDILLDGPKETVTDKDAKDVKKTEEDVPKKDSTLNPTQTGGTPANVPQTTSTPLGTKAKNWDYFEIDHPKAISEKKLQQLKAKYLRRKTEASMSNSRTTSTIKEEDEKNAAGPEQKRPSEHRKVRPPPPPPPPPEVRLEAKPPPTRSNSVPIVQGINIQSVKSEGLQLSIDPLTSQCMDKEQETPQSIFLSVVTRKTSSDSNLDVAEAMSRKSSSGSIRRKTSNLENIEEHAIPDNHVLQVSIDPFTGRFETCEIEKRPGKPQVSVKLAKSTTEDDGFGSLPHSPIEQKLEQSLGESLTQSRLDDDGVFTSSEEVLNAIQRDEMTDSLPTTSSQPSGSTDSLSGLFFHQRLEKVQFHNDNDDDDDSDTTNPPHDPNNTDQHHNQ